jgi:hypothetical protein
MTPADCDLRGLPFMPLKVIQLMQSETYGLSSGDEFKAAFTLWCASWLEVPAASLPSDERMLEFLSRAKNWKRVRNVAMRGWVKCSDGRLYHAVVAANALEAWDKRTDYRDKEDNKNERQKRWREQCKQLAGQLREMGITPPRGASLETLRKLYETHHVDTHASIHVDGVASTVDDVEIGIDSKETVKRQLTTKPYADDDSTDSGSASDDKRVVGGVAPLPMRENPPLSLDPAVQLSVALRRLGVNVMSTNPHLLQWVADQVPLEQLTEAVTIARETKGTAPIPPGYLVPIVEKLRNPPAPAASGTAQQKPREDWSWKRSRAGIDAKGKELGMRPRGNEQYDDFAARIEAEILKRKGSTP